MRNLSLAIFATFFLVGAAHAQQAQSVTSTTSHPAASIPGIDNAVLARSARAGQLIGSKVFRGDISIGHIEDVLVDLDQASVAAVILSVGGFLGVGEKLVAVPVNQIKLGKEARFTTDPTKDQLASAPAFDFSKLE